jgi:hypothetical protein
MADNFTSNPGTGGPSFRASDLGAGVLMPLAQLRNGANGVDGGAVTPTSPYSTSSGTPAFIPLNAVTANGTSTTVALGAARSSVSLQVILGGSVIATGGTVSLYGSIDGTHFDPAPLIVWTIGTQSSGNIEYSTGKPIVAFNAILAGLTGGTSPTVTAFAAAA